MSSLSRGTLHYGTASSNSIRRIRPAVLTVTNILVLLLGWISQAAGYPLEKGTFTAWKDVDEGKDAKDPSLWAYLGVAAALVLAGGAFAGLTIALMGQDEIYLQVIATSGEGSERKNAKKVLGLLKKGKHWVLVTLLLSNVITNETLPIVLDRSLGGGWPAVLSSTVLIVIFGEIVPQSICVAYGLPIGAFMSPMVLALMWIMAPIAWPTAKLLDYLIGEDHGQTYKKAGLKTLVTLHKTLGESPAERLNEDEVKIIAAVLDLKEKTVGSIMTPMNDVFTLSADTVLDEEMMDKILIAGYSRIPIYQPDNPRNFVGMLLVKMLITYDPEDAFKVRDFALATLPETRPETSCLDIINFFQEGKSHMVLISDYPGEPYGALGVVTLEDVIEELIGEEIIDESDVFVDVHKAIRRMQPAPRTRMPKGKVLTDPEPGTITQQEGAMDHPSHKGRRGSDNRPGSRKTSGASGLASSPGKPTTFLMRRRSSQDQKEEVQLRSNTPEARQRLRHLGPSNAAKAPKPTRISTVRIKAPGIETIPENRATNLQSDDAPARAHSVSEVEPAIKGTVGEGLLANSGRDASDGALAVHSVNAGYGTLKRSSSSPPSRPAISALGRHDSEPVSPGGNRVDNNASGEAGHPETTDTSVKPDEVKKEDPKDTPEDPIPRPEKLIVDFKGRSSSSSSGSSDTLGALRRTSSGDIAGSKSTYRVRGAARSGSITENLIDVGGMKKLVLDTTSSDDADENSKLLNGEENGNGNGHGLDGTADEASANGDGKKKKRKKRSKKSKGKGKSEGGEGKDGEGEPLLGGDKADE